MIKLINVSKYYSTENTVVQALKNINLEFNIGEFVAITGESGSGKTTLLNIISFIDTIEDGDLFINGKNVSSIKQSEIDDFRKEYISFIFQNYNLIDSYTVYKNVESALIFKGLSRSERKEKVKEIIEKVGLKGRLHHRASKLSGGEKQRVAIARAIAQDTKIIIADEPTGNLDSENGNQVIKLLSDLAKDKLVIIVTHNYGQVEKYVTRKVRLFDGEVVEDKKLKEYSGLIETKKEEKSINLINRSINISFNNFISQIKNSFFMFSVTFVLVFLIFFFYAIALNFKDPLVNSIIYLNGYPERLIIKKEDNSTLTEADYNYLSKHNKIKNVYKNDIALDMRMNFSYHGNNYYDQGYTFSGKYDISKDIFYSQHLYGRLPKETFEVVVKLNYEKHNKEYINRLLNKEILVNFIDRNTGTSIKLKLVGFIHHESIEEDTFYVTDETLNIINESILSDYIQINQKVYSEFINEKLYFNKRNSIIIDAKLNGYEIVSYRLFDKIKSRPYLSYEVFGEELIIKDHSYREDKYYDTIFVSYELYNRLMNEQSIEENYQWSINLKNKFDYKNVTKELQKKGYYVYSPFYDNAVSMEDPLAFNIFLSNNGIQIGLYLLIIIFYMISYLIYKVIYRRRIKDYAIFKVIGASNLEIKSIIYFEFVLSFLCAYISFFTLYFFIKNKNPLLYYFRINDYLIILLMNILLPILLVSLIFKSINKKSIFSILKG